jgi:hypothetical protein
MKTIEYADGGFTIDRIPRGSTLIRAHFNRKGVMLAAEGIPTRGNPSGWDVAKDGYAWKDAQGWGEIHMNKQTQLP